MPNEKSKPSKNTKPEKGKKSGGEIRDDDLRSVSGGVANNTGVRGGTDVCIT